MIKTYVDSRLPPILAPVLQRWQKPQVCPLASPAAATCQDDFECQHTLFLLAGALHSKAIDVEHSQLAGKTIYKGISFSDTPANLKVLAEQLGFAVHQSADFYFPRDHFIRLPNQQVAMPYASNFMAEAIAKVRSSALYWQKSAASCTNNQLFNAWSGYTGTKKPNAADIAEIGPIKQFAQTYVEGGNVFCVTHPLGHVQVLVGEDHFFHTWLALELENVNWENLAKQAFPAQAKEANLFDELCRQTLSHLDQSAIYRELEELFAFGLWPKDAPSGQLAVPDQLNLLLMRLFFRRQKPLFRAFSQHGHSGWNHSTFRADLQSSKS